MPILTTVLDPNDTRSPSVTTTELPAAYASLPAGTTITEYDSEEDDRELGVQIPRDELDAGEWRIGTVVAPTREDLEWAEENFCDCDPDDAGKLPELHVVVVWADTPDEREWLPAEHIVKAEVV